MTSHHRRTIAASVLVLAVLTSSVPALTSVAAASPKGHVVGTWQNASESGTGGWILWSNGKVQPVAGAPFYGDARHSGMNDFVGMIASDELGGEGYFLVTSTGKVDSFGPTCGSGSSLVAPAHLPTSRVIGLIEPADNTHVFAMVTANGLTFGFQCDFND